MGKARMSAIPTSERVGTSVAVAATSVPASGRFAVSRWWILVLGAAGAAITFVGAGVPSYWGDEAASVLSAQRPLGSLLAELTHVDAVHGVYNLFLHFWTGAFGTTEAVVRFPSAVAAGAAVAGTVALGRQLVGARAALVAGIVACAIPQLTRMAIEARSYAFGMAAAVWLTWLLVLLIRRRERRRRIWALYVIGLALSIWLFVYLGLMVLVHLVVVLVERPERSVARRWVLSVAIALAACLPIAAFAVAQHDQIAYLAHRNYATALNVLVHQWFRIWYVAVIAWTLIVIGIVTSRRPRGAVSPSTRRGMTVVAAWIVLPTAVLLAGNAWLAPMYNLRYLSFCVPAIALAMGQGIVATASVLHHASVRRALVAALVAGVVAASVPSFLAQRTPYAKDGGSDLRQLAVAVQTHAAAGDAIVFGESVVPRLKPRLALDLYPSSFSGIDDVALVTPYAERAGLWDAVAPLESLRSRLAGHEVVWAAEPKHGEADDLRLLRDQGYQVVDTVSIHRTVLYQLRRTP